ncbi:hypothetical protein Lalb_Chr18g0057291 [Lupinus albus]|uniref:Uncharacterized protein n=1 Tax=Lupinus albus TaxID=3870 RepID=A0A6A4P532_LUPAL|nr:hypothetical protein Lalb_Chr18g0057291 [Lupinus albus]
MASSKAYICCPISLKLLSFTMVELQLYPIIPTPPNRALSKGYMSYRYALKLGVCAKVLNLVNVKLGSPPTLPC